MRSAVHLSIIVMLFEVIACGSVKAVTDAGVPGTDGQVSDGQVGDGQVPDGPVGASCDFVKIGNACAFPPHVPIEPVRTCLAATAQPALAPPVGATVTFRKNGSTYQLDCTPNCGGSTMTIAAQEAVFQMSAPLIEVFCLSSANIPAGVSVVADPTFDRAIAIVASDAIAVGGVINVSGKSAPPGDIPGGAGGPGGYVGGGRVAPFNGAGPCGGVGGTTQGPTLQTTGSGGAGAGHAGTGGNGGAGTPGAAGGTGGCSAAYVKLEGGSGGGAGGPGTVINASGPMFNFDEGFSGAGGGGALAIISRTSVAVTGSILANGAPGSITANNSSFNYNACGGTGGGAGGTIVLAAPSVNVSGALRVEGGNGVVAWGTGGTGAQGTSPNGTAGRGGPSSGNGGAGGGGGGGYVRIFAAAGTANCAAVTSPTAGCENNPLPDKSATP